MGLGIATWLQRAGQAMQKTLNPHTVNNSFAHGEKPETLSKHREVLWIIVLKAQWVTVAWPYTNKTSQSDVRTSARRDEPVTTNGYLASLLKNKQYACIYLLKASNVNAIRELSLTETINIHNSYWIYFPWLEYINKQKLLRKFDQQHTNCRLFSCKIILVNMKQKNLVTLLL